MENIFLIDDDADEAELFHEAIREIGTAVNLISFNNGLEALKVLRDRVNQPKLIFLDLNMPMFSGVDVLKQLRSNPITQAIPVVIYSTTISKAVIDDTAIYDVKGYLQKPDDFHSLCSQLSQYLPG